jgi:sulfotransferase
MKEIFFLSGLPRSGSTLLGSIIGQNPAFTVTPTSPMLDLMCVVHDGLNKLNQQYTFNAQSVSERIYNAIPRCFYGHVQTDYVLDKHRGHPKNVEAIKKHVSENPKIICTNRPIAEVIASYIVLINKRPLESNVIDRTLELTGKSITTENRARCIWEEFLKDPYESMGIGLSTYRRHIFIAEYDRIVSDFDKLIREIYQFLGVEAFQHSTERIRNYCAEEKDEMWGIKGLHEIRERVARTSVPPEQVLGRYLTDYYNQFSLP